MNKPFIMPGELPKATLADGTPVKFGKPSKVKKSRLGARFNGKHHD